MVVMSVNVDDSVVVVIVVIVMHNHWLAAIGFSNLADDMPLMTGRRRMSWLGVVFIAGAMSVRSAAS